MAPLETLIEDHIAAVLNTRPYAEVGDLLDDERTFIKDLARDIRELWDDLS